MLVIAQHRPRNEQTAYDNIMIATKRPSFASKARYIYPRGGQNITGPSVNLAREIARCWGNIESGSRVTERTDTHSTIQGWAWDLQTNSIKTESTVIENKIFRKNKGWLRPDERDYAELVGRNGAKLERNAILRIVPTDIVEDAMEGARKTLEDVAAGDGKAGLSRRQWISALTSNYAAHSVTVTQLEAHVGCPLGEMTKEHAAELQGMLQSISDGAATARELFPPPAPKEEPGGKPKTLEELGSETSEKEAS